MAPNGRRPDERRKLTLADYLAPRGVFDLSPSPDGKEIAFVTNLDGTPQLWKIAAEGGFPVQLTRNPSLRFNWLFGVYGTGLIRWSPDSKRLAYLVDNNGDEKNRIRIVTREGDDEVSLPWQEKEQCGLGVWTHDSRSFYFTSNRRDEKVFDVFRFDLASGKTRAIYAGNDNDDIPGIPPRNGLLPLRRGTSYRRSDCLLLDLKTRKATLVTPWHGDFDADPFGFSRGGDLLLSLRGPGSEFFQIAALKRNGDAWAPRLLSRGRWDKSGSLSPDGKTVAVVANEDGSDILQLIPSHGGAPRAVPVPKGGTLSFVRFASNRRLVFAHSSPASSEDVYALDLVSKRLTRLTALGNARLKQQDLSSPRLIHYRSGTHTISSWLFMPAKRTGRKPPCIVWIHGGPHGQMRAKFFPRLQVLAGLGYALWVPNHRGSTGYGRSFSEAIDRSWGDVDVDDLKAGLAWLKTSGRVDLKRLAVMGGSYGGYMTLRAMTELPKVWKCGIDVFGPSNLLTMLTSDPPSWRKYTDEAIGHVVKDRKRLIRQSPIFQIKRLRKPLLVIQGATDPRVTQGESDQVVAALKRRKIPVEYLVFPDEGHGFSKRENELSAYSHIEAFLAKRL